MLGKGGNNKKMNEAEEEKKEKKDLEGQQEPYEIGKFVDVAKLTKFIGARGPDL
jgi:hypothetical protein